MTIRNFKIVALIESISWAVLIIAMIVKYGFDREEATRIPGMVHGMLFLAFLVMLIGVTTTFKWPIMRAVKIFFLSLIPIGGYFLIDHSVEDAA